MMEDLQLQLAISTSPHLKTPVTVHRAMGDVIIALIPVTLVSVYLFKFYAVLLIAVCLVTAALTELLFKRIAGRPVSLNDGSALVTGLLVALLFGPGTPWWTAALATFIGIGVAKELVGGLGWNRFNPAIFGRLSVILIAPLFYYIRLAFEPFRQSFGPLDAITQGTPLAQLMQGQDVPVLSQFIFAYPGGSLSETSALAILVGGLYLLFKKHISWHAPLAILATVALIALVSGGNPFYHIAAGGVMIGAFFMATDWVTSPITPKGKVIFGILIGALTMVFRLFLAPTEGMAFAILIMNGFVPTIDSATMRLRFGEKSEQTILSGK